MDLSCPVCATPLQATATDQVTVIVCPRCSHVIRIPHDGGAHSLTITATIPAPPPPAALETTALETAAEQVEETYSYADERRWGDSRATSFVPGTRLGDYELLAEIAHGGMGVVYKARQVKLGRVVALKMILSGQLATEEEVRRFYAEAQSAAHLDHPGIVPVYEVGEHQGRHFYSMGFVEGSSLSGRLADGPLEPREAAELMLKTARAVAYAHQHGVIHRDLKPSNILVDAAGQPRVTDFGLAKRVEADSELTKSGGVLGTPSYMPPEQAAGRSEEIGPLADVYSLGATLYCLLTARPPFQAAHVAETLRQVIEQEPVSPRQLNTAVDRDLETICLKCLQKESARRYASAAALADDLERYLEGQPILARPISRVARLARWCRRNPRVAVLVAALVLALVGGTVVSMIFGVQATLALGREREALTKKDAALEETEQTIDKYVATVRNHELLKDARFQLVLKDLLKEALAHYERYIEEHRDDHDTPTQAKLAKALYEVGWINDASGDKSEAIAAFQQALAMFERLARDNPTVAQYQGDLARAHNRVGNLYSATGNPDEALTAYRKALAIRERLALANRAVTEYQADLAEGYNNIGVLYRETGKPAEALAAYESTLTIQERLVRENPNVAQYRFELAGTHNNIANLYSHTGKPAEALAGCEKALTIHERLVRENPNLAEYRFELAGTHNNIGNLYSDMRKPDEALAAYEKALAIMERLARENPTVTQYQSELARAHNSIGNEHGDMGKPAKALAAYETALAIHARLARENPAVAEHQRDLAGSHYSIGRLLRKTGKPAEALAAFENALAIRERLAREIPAVTEYLSELASTHNNIGIFYHEAGKPTEALAAFEKALAIRERLARENPTATEYQVDLAGSYVIIGDLRTKDDPEGAEADFGKTIKLLQGVVAREPPHRRARMIACDARAMRAQMRDHRGQYDLAAADWEQALALDDSRSHYGIATTRLSLSLARAGKRDKATATVDSLTKDARDGEMLVNLARVYALSAAAATRDKSLKPGEQTKLADAYAAKAIELVQRAAKAGHFGKPEHLKDLETSADFASLRARDAFRSLLESLPPKAGKPSPH